MEPLTFVEILDKRGHVMQRVRVERLPATIGRAYTNDVILDDPFVSAEHAGIGRDDAGNIRVEDLGSKNGLYQLHPSQQIAHAPVAGEQQFRVGQTILRIRDAHHPVPVTLPLRVSRKAGQVFENRLACSGIVAFVAAMLAMDAYLASYERLTPGPILTKLAALAALLIVWAGGWSLASRVFSSQFRLAQHAAAAALCVLAFCLFDHALDYYAFAFAADRSVQVLGWGGAFGWLAITMYSHLRLSSAAPRSRLALGAILAAGAVVGLAGLLVAGIYSSPSAYYFTSQPRYPAQLKPPSTRIAHSRGVEDFFSEARELRARVDAASADR